MSEDNAQNRKVMMLIETAICWFCSSRNQTLPTNYAPSNRKLCWKL